MLPIIISKTIPVYISLLSSYIPMVLIYNWCCDNALFTNLLYCFNIVTCAFIIHVILWNSLDQDGMIFEIFNYISLMIHENFILAYMTMGIKNIVFTIIKNQHLCNYIVVHGFALCVFLVFYRTLMMILYYLTIDYHNCRCGPVNQQHRIDWILYVCGG